MNIVTRPTPAASTAPKPSRSPYNPAAAASANTGLLLAAQGYSGTQAPSVAAGSSFDRAAAGEGSAAGLLGYLGYSLTRSPGTPGVPAKGSSFDPAAAAESSAAQLFGFSGFQTATATASTSPFGAASTGGNLAPADYGRGQYAFVYALLNAGFSSTAHGGSGSGPFRAQA